MILDILVISIRVIAVALSILLLCVCHNGRYPALQPVRTAVVVSVVLILAVLTFDLLHLLSFISTDIYSQYRRVPGNLLLVTYPLSFLLFLIKHE